MTDREREIIKGMCDNNMSVSRTARSLYLHRNSIEYNSEKIKEKYGLNVKCYHDLVKLEQMVQEDKK